MKIAICFRGEIRTGVEASANILNFIGDLLPNCDFFVHTWDNSEYRVLCKQPYEDLILQNRDMWENHAEKIEKIKKLYNPKLIKIENFNVLYNQIVDRYGNLHKKYINQFFIPRFYSWREVVKLKQQYELENRFIYDHVVVLRFDTIYSNKTMLSDFLQKVNHDEFGVNGLWGDNKDIPDDMFFISSSPAMDKASMWQEHRYYHAQVEDYLYNPDWIKLHAPFYYYVKSRGYNVIDLQLKDFYDDVAVLRKECLQYNPIEQFHKCRACDKLHYHIQHNTDIHYTLLTQDELIRDARLTLATRKYLPPVFNDLKDQL